MRTLLEAPIQHRGELLGNLYLSEKDGGELFTSTDAQIVAMFAAQAGIAIHNATLFEREQRARIDAKTVQLAEQRVPTSAPIRSAPDISALSARDKIAYALTRQDNQ